MEKLVVVALFVAACSPSTPQSDRDPEAQSNPVLVSNSDDSESSPIPQTDLKVASFLALPAIGTEPGSTHNESRTAKMRAAKEVNDELKEHLEGAGRDLVAHVQFQRARLFMAVACQLLQAPGPGGGSDAEQRAHRAKMIEAAHLFFPGVQQSLRASVDADGRRSQESAQLLLVMESASGPTDTCDRTTSVWKP